MESTHELIVATNQLLDRKHYQELHWNGSFSDYLASVQKNPDIARTAFQRLYDMILSHGSEDYTEYKKKITRYHFFSDPFEGGKDAVYGLDLHLMKMVNVIKAAAHGYGTEKRVLLLHGPVGSAKSTIARLLKKGLEHYSQTEAGKLYTYSWIKGPITDNPRIRELFGTHELLPCPMHEEPLRLIPEAVRHEVLAKLNAALPSNKRIDVHGDLCPFCRFIYKGLLDIHKGDWEKILSHIEVKRLVLSERDRIGIGTFQPKDEKNQDSTELTGDINYRKIAESSVESWFFSSLG